MEEIAASVSLRIRGSSSEEGSSPLSSDHRSDADRLVISEIALKSDAPVEKQESILDMMKNFRVVSRPIKPIDDEPDI